jgi:hypothetical protein
MRLENAGKLLGGLHPNTVRNRAVKGKLLQLSLTSSYKKTPGSQAGLSGSSVDQWQERRKGGRAGETAMLASVRGERGTGAAFRAGSRRTQAFRRGCPLVEGRLAGTLCKLRR